MTTFEFPDAPPGSGDAADARYPRPKASIHLDQERSWVGRMVPIMTSHKGSFIAAWTATSVSVLLALASPWLVREGVNGLVLRREHTVRTVAVALIAIAAGRFICGYVHRYWMLRSAYAIEYDLRSLLYEHLTHLSFSFYDRTQSGQLISRANSDIRSIQTFLTFAPTVAIQLATFVIALVLMARVNLWLTLIAVLPMPGVWYIGTKMRQQMFPTSWLVQQRLAEVATIVDESVAGVRIVKSFAAELQQIRRLAGTAHRLRWASVKRVDIRARFAPALQNLPVVGSVGILLYGGYLVANGRLDVGSILLFQSYLIWLIAPFRQLGFLLVQHERARASAARVFEVLDTRPDVQDRVGAVDFEPGIGLVEFRDVSFGYESDRLILDGFSMQIRPGETLALVGRNGSGKSTAARLLMRFYDVESGAVLVDGQDVRDVTQESLRSRIGFVADDAFLFSDTVANNIAYARPHASRGDIVAAAIAAGADGFITHLPKGYDSSIAERGYDLSGGQRQRVSLARLFLKDPNILILDEATSSIDVRTELEIHDALVRVMKDRTTLIIAHRLSTIGLADRVALLHEGRIVAEGAHQDLLRTEPRYGAVLAQLEEDDARRAADPDGRSADREPPPLDDIGPFDPPIDGDGWRAD